ncbi:MULTISPECIES: DUF4190 domain-containing protein [Micromonospora]|uniref:DUF4190 domain-containing protein n=1 Tax=Micromonospora solifontis TaxID=2487138 RepID=A0ABX9WFQ4_9ACTN|nr:MULTISPECIES: DUF4190 domain-containing protein [Micromonospora]NES14170.1 DUF4190 domain-containing protein [Micromonospora sp. PPF5-17B]NES37994.1 DUF4190 domain-containing protein [Micromonospora solifontis]NES55881.1 DUF4190 domain-containing protein [Micromonospora sp. PPF5-6]RNL97750.1 DUF4190 domain-containing protein [Micromonospora solifontis]
MSQPPGEPEQPPSPYEPPSYGQPYGGQSQHPQWGQQPPPYPPQPPYGQYGPPGEPPRPRGTNVLAVLSLVFAFVFAPAGIVLGHLAKRQIRQTGEEGDQLATWGLILSYVFTVLGLLACCGWIGLAWWANSDNGNYR